MKVTVQPFEAGAYENDLIVLIGYVTYTGNMSLEVRIDTCVENQSGMRYPINRVYFVMVAMGKIISDEGAVAYYRDRRQNGREHFFGNRIAWNAERQDFNRGILLQIKEINNVVLWKV